ncbi:hypothetical protein BCVP_CDS0044 [Bacillus phage BC-VP]|nr:hypothetical protein BCVP_CDS0044 [Bacillus phage BC-VP]
MPFYIIIEETVKRELSDKFPLFIKDVKTHG